MWAPVRHLWPAGENAPSRAEGATDSETGRSPVKPFLVRFGPFGAVHGAGFFYLTGGGSLL